MTTFGESRRGNRLFQCAAVTGSLLVGAALVWGVWHRTHHSARAGPHEIEPQATEKLKEELVRIDAGARFLRFRSVQKELGLTAEQRDKAYRLANEMTDRELDARQNGTGGLPPGALSEAERNREFLSPAQRN